MAVDRMDVKLKEGDQVSVVLPSIRGGGFAEVVATVTEIDNGGIVVNAKEVTPGRVRVSVTYDFMFHPRQGGKVGEIMKLAKADNAGLEMVKH